MADLTRGFALIAGLASIGAFLGFDSTGWKLIFLLVGGMVLLFLGISQLVRGLGGTIYRVTQKKLTEFVLHELSNVNTEVIAFGGDLSWITTNGPRLTELVNGSKSVTVIYDGATQEAANNANTLKGYGVTVKHSPMRNDLRGYLIDPGKSAERFVIARKAARKRILGAERVIYFRGVMRTRALIFRQRNDQLVRAHRAYADLAGIAL